MSARKKKVAENPAEAKPEPFPIVGIGASAGGLAAFQEFFSSLPPHTPCGMAFVLVQHLDPNHKSLLAELINRRSQMEVQEVEDGVVVKPNCVYVIPPNRDMAYMQGALHLMEPHAARGTRMPIDFFFRSLAQEQGERAIGIVLSGTGTDGTLGAREIKGAGGMIMAQSPDSAEFDGMPRSALSTGLVDFVLPPAQMPVRLIAYAEHRFGGSGGGVVSPLARREDALRKIFVLLRAQTGHDFSGYKQNTVNRRIERRMAVHQIDKVDDYVRYLQLNPAEVEALFRDMLIGVTQFFRDPEAFSVLEKVGIPMIFADKSPGSSIRAWVSGCSTGEEAVTIAILLQEYADSLRQNHKIQVFTTDIDVRGLECARQGLYPASIAADISAQRLARYFVLEPDGMYYRVNKLIRSILIFSEHDVIRDPPFSKLDLISCRNLLIYMGPELQKRLIPLFHYALNPGGVLFLGISETIGDFVDLFSPLERKAKLYQKRVDTQIRQQAAIGSFLVPLAESNLPTQPPKKLFGDRSTQLRDMTERTLLGKYAPVAVLVNGRGDIFYFQGRTGLYLEPAHGEAATNVVKMAREGLRRELTTALHKAVAHKQTVNLPKVKVKTNGDFSTINLHVLPVTDGPEPGAETGLWLVVFEPAADEASGGIGGELPADAEQRLEQLRQELKSKEEYLQATNEELETINEELKSANEEMQSVNEELQSSNEELETAKEESQSVNEELATVNAELQSKVSDLSRANNDMNNLLAGTGIGTIFVDHDLRIQRFTPAITKVLNLIQTDIGRPVGHIVSNLVGYDRLVYDLKETMDTLAAREVEVQTQTGDWFLLRIGPYRTLENVIEGAVITFTEITKLKKAQAQLEELVHWRGLATAALESNDTFIVFRLDGTILSWNPAAERLYGWTEAEAKARGWNDLTPEALREEPSLRLRQLCNSRDLQAVRVERMNKAGETFAVNAVCTGLSKLGGPVYGLCCVERRVDTP